MKGRKYIPLLVLAACIAAALVFRRFVYVAWYPVMMSAAVSLSFALSLRTRPLCLVAAEKIPPGILPEGGEDYCRRYTLFWAVWLAINGLIAVATIYAPGPVWRLGGSGIEVPWVWVVWNCCLSYCATGLIVLVEWFIRRRRFAATFHTSGSTAAPKTIVKTFDTLAKEVVFHRNRLKDVLARKPLFLATIEPHHMYGILWRVLLPKASGCPVDPEVILTPESLLAKMRSAKEVFLVTTPSFLERFCAYADQYDVPQNAIEITTSGALLTAEVSAAAKRVFGRAPLEIFGSTETGGVASRRQGERLEWEVFEPVKVGRNEEGRLVVDSPFSCEKGFMMGDGVELAEDGRSFALLGRMDRMVKIAEQRVSLPEMEEKMKVLPDIADAALCALEGPHGPYLGAVVVLACAANAKEVGKKKSAMDLRSRLLPLFPKGTVPRKYRFVRELPRNPQGKVRTAALRAVLESEFAEPFVENEVRTSESYAADFTFDRDAAYFGGHFPGFPVLPGVVQLGMAHHFAELFMRRERPLRTVKKMKFSRVVVPAETVRFTLTKRSEDEYAYEYRKGEALCSSGVLCF